MTSNVVDFSSADAYHAAERDRGGQPPPRQLPRIRIDPGNLPKALDETETAVIDSWKGTIDDLYVYGARLVQVSWSKVRVSGNRTELSLQHQAVTPHNLLERFAKAAEYERWAKGAKKYVICDPPSELAHTYLSRSNWEMPTLLGVVTAPTLRADGAVIETPGYDASSGLIYDPIGVSFPPVPLSPTKEEALRALSVLSKPISLYKFPTPADRSVALSGILTALVRSAVPNVPLHAIDAPTAGSGKSNLVDVASVLATGHAAAVTSTGGNPQEFYKRLSALVLAGEQIVAIDNVSETLESDLLCQLLTQSMVNVRIFGKLDNVVVPSTATFFVTGNNLTMAGDLTRRALTCRIDTETEQPELQTYPFHPVELARQHRARYVVAALTVIRAYLASGETVGASAIGSYQEWSRLVREPLIWLGQPDPVDVIARARRGDPRLQRLVDVVSSWANILGLENSFFTRDLIAKASEEQDLFGEHATRREYKYPFFRDALLAAAPSQNGQINPDRLGWWLRRSRARPVKIEYLSDRVTVRIVQDENTGQGVKWQLVIVEERAENETPVPFDFSDENPPF